MYFGYEPKNLPPVCICGNSFKQPCPKHDPPTVIDLRKNADQR